MEPTRSAQVAKEIACQITARGSCALTGLHIEEPGFPSDIAKSNLYQSLIETLQTHAACQTSGGDAEALLTNQNIRSYEKTLIGPKFTMLAQEAERNDLTLLGREGNFEELADDAKEVISLMLQYRPRPMIIAPPEPVEGNEVLVAYDGNPTASRAIQMFILLGLAEGMQLHLLCIDRKEKVAQAKIDSIHAFLNQHEVSATTEIIESRSSPGEVLTSRINSSRPSMVVAGAKGTSGWRRSMFGSTGDFLIRHCPVPLFTSP
jgi:nucleotide-binding universal stress UspA family protein